jgi:hypothetical protein
MVYMLKFNIQEFNYYRFVANIKYNPFRANLEASGGTPRDGKPSMKN